MKKVVLRLSLLACVTVCATQTSNAQSSRATLDNFGTPNGISVYVPPPPVAKATLPADAVLIKNKKSRRGEPRGRVKPTALSVARGIEKVVYDATGRYVPPSVDPTRAMKNFTTGDAKIDRYIVESGVRNGVDPMLLYSVMHQESGFKPRALSNKGAAGLMQLMPGTAARFGITNRYDPQQSVEGGARYIRFLLNFFNGNVTLTLAGYNAGEGAVLKYGRQIPPYRETQEYVRRITARYDLIRSPQVARLAPVVTAAQVKTIVKEKPLPLPVLEREVAAIKMPDGKLRLTSQ